VEIGSESRRSLSPLHQRTVVFISHVNPQNNAEAAWYGARLTAAGYQVWTDLTRLLGGEEMWRDIDDALRYDVRKFVVLLSRGLTLETKEGVRAEIDRAQAIRKQLGDRRFIIPVRIDDVPYEDLPPMLGNRTIIDAGTNPADGLARILKILDRDNVARSATPSANALARWHAAFAAHPDTPEVRNETLVSDWREITHLPDILRVFTIERPLSNPLTEPIQLAKAHPFPMAAHFRRLISFAPWDAVQEPIAATTPVRLDHQVPLATFLAGGDDRIAIAPQEARKLLRSLLRQAFDAAARARGLSCFALSENKNAWWVPDGLLGNEKVQFVRASGVAGWRQLTGEYNARTRSWRWHYGVAGSPVFGDRNVFKLTGHVIYTDPTGKLQPSAQYRRSHCRMWFNADWRDRLYALVALLSEGRSEIPLPFGGNVLGRMSAHPLTLVHGVAVPLSLDRKSARAPGPDGDSAALDTSDRENDPMFMEDESEATAEAPDVDADEDEADDTWVG
jgi:hypothetical protein